MIFRKRVRIRFGDIDDAGITYYPSYFHYYHCCFEDWWSDALAAPYPGVIEKERFGLPTVKVEAEYFAPIRYGDDPEISLAILALGRTSVQFAYWMKVDGRERPTSRARITTVSTNLDTMTKMEIPVRWRARFEEFLIGEQEFPA